jgi:hypothetical protein
MKKTLYVFLWAFISLLALPSAAQVPDYVPTDGLVGWWPFNGNANDESGNGNDGIVNGATITTDRVGMNAKAFLFDGNTNHIQIPPSLTLNNFNNAITISSWIYCAGQSGVPSYGNQDLQGIFGPATYLINDGGFFLRLNDPNFDNINNRRIQYVNGLPGVSITSNSIVDNDSWENIICTYDGNILQIYRNGILTDSQIVGGGLTNSLNTSGRYYTIGYCIDWSATTMTQPFNGKLDDIAIYNRALTEQEIQNLYTGTTPEQCTSLPSNLQEGLVGYWPFCGNANDESGNGNDGTVNGATLTEDRFGNANAAYSFDGNTSFIQINEDSVFNLLDESSFVCWFNDSVLLSNPGGRVVSKLQEALSPPAGWVLSIDNVNHGGESNQYKIRFTIGGVQHYSSLINCQSDWQFLAATYDLETVKIYLNQDLIYSIAQSSNTILFNSPVIIGSYTYAQPNLDNIETFPGPLDDIGIWNRALTPEEVQELYTLDACTFTVYDTSYVTVYDTLTTYETVYDTLYTYETIYDTVTTYVTVTDTLLIDITFTGIEGQPSWLNTVTVFPNPASDHITIDYGNFALLAGYNTIITDAAGATVYSSTVNSQQAYIDINAWGAAGVYFLTIYDAGGAPVAVRHIVLE